MQISNNMQNYNPINQKTKQNELNPKEQIEDFLKNIPQDEWGTYDPNEIYKRIGKYEEDSDIYKELQNHLLKGIMYYGIDPNKKYDFFSEDAYKIKPSDSTMAKSIKLQLQVGFDISNNTIYQRAFYTSAGAKTQRDLMQFLNENKIKDFELKDNFFRLPNDYADELIDLFANEEISVEDFKKEYLKIKEKIDKLENEKDKSNNEFYDTKEEKNKESYLKQ